MHLWIRQVSLGLVAAVGSLVAVYATTAPQSAIATPPAPRLVDLGPKKTIAEADCVAAKLGTSIPASAIGEPVRDVTLAAPRWVAANGPAPARCEVDGVIAPVDTAATARPINFRVALPAEWNHRAVQQGGGGMNGSIPDLSGGRYSIGGQSQTQLGFVTYGSDSGHQSGGQRGPGAGGPGAGGAAARDWALNDEAMKNLGYMQLKKTHDAAMVLIERLYGERPRYNYFSGTSQGGREALTVAQRYPADYHGIVANVPIVNFSSLMLAPELIRIQEKPAANWVTRAKVNVIRGEFMRQCDGLDGLVDGVMNNYQACRAIFDVAQGAPGRHPWAAKRCPDNVDPNPADTTAAACLTDGQISTLEFVYRRYRFATPLANGVKSFGMWVPNTDPSGSGLIADVRYRGQEGTADEAPVHSHLGILGVTGFLMRDVAANPLDYREGGALDARRQEISASLDSTDPDLRRFAARGGKMIVTIGTNDTLASPGAQLDYYQSLLDTMGRVAVDTFARLFVIPQAGHGLAGTVYVVDGAGKTIPTPAIANDYERFGYLVSWVERGQAPGKTLTVTAADRSMPLCSYPQYPKYLSGPPAAAASYTCAP
jgi:feruloyl esterase